MISLRVGSGSYESSIEKTEVSVTPFIRSLFLENSMKLFKEVQEKCSCYLGMNADFSGILLYGLMEDQKKASVSEGMKGSHV